MSDLLLAGAIVALPAMLLFAVGAARRPALAVCLIPLSFPIEQLELDLPVRVIQLASVGAVGLVALHQRAARAPLVARSGVLFAAALVVLSALVSTMVSVDPPTALRLDVSYLLGLAVAGAVVIACPDRRSLQLLIGCTCGVGVVVCAAGLSTANQLRSHYAASVVDNRATGFFGQPNEMGTFAALMVVLSLALLFSCRPGPIRLLPAASVLVSAAALVVSLSRGSWIGLAFGLAVFVLLVPGARRSLLRGLIGLSVFIVVVAVALPASPLMSIVADRAASFVDGRDNPYDDRPAIWREALRQIVLRPVLGSGPGGYPVLALRGGSRVTTVVPNHAHDLFLTLAAEQGLLGIAALVAAVAVAAVAVVRTLRWREPWPGNVRANPVRVTQRAIAGLADDGGAVGRGVIVPGLTLSGSTVGPDPRPRNALTASADRARPDIVDDQWGQPSLSRRPGNGPPVTGPRGLGARIFGRPGKAEWGSVRVYRKRQSNRGNGERELLAGATAALAVVLGQGFVDYPLRNPVLSMMVWLLIGLLAAAVSGRDRLQRSDPETIAMRHVQHVGHFSR